MDVTEETGRQLDRKRDDTNIFKGQIPCTPSRSVICPSHFECLRFFSYGFLTFRLLYFQWLQLDQQAFITSILLLQIWFSRGKQGLTSSLQICFPGMINAKCFPIAELQPRTLCLSVADIPAKVFFFLLHSLPVIFFWWPELSTISHA